MTFQERYQYNPRTDLLGKGGFARVYKAKDTLLNRTVALKFFIDQSDNKHTLIQEISKAIHLDHPNLCRYYDAAVIEGVNIHGEAETTEVGVMEYLDGGDLKKFLSHSPTYLNKLLLDVLHGLSFLHRKGIIHRDLKTQNILIKNTEDGPVARITDFGISKAVNSEHSSSSVLMGTIEYMAPEQFNPDKYGIGGKIGTNVDLWSFGVMVYELLTGTTLFGGRSGGTSAEQVMSNILNDAMLQEKLRNLPAPYQQLLQSCLVKDARQRAQDADTLIALLAGNATTTMAATSPVPTRPAGETSPAPMPPAGATAPAPPPGTETIAIPKVRETQTIRIDRPESPAAPGRPARGRSKKPLLWAGLLFVVVLAGVASWWLTQKHAHGALHLTFDKTTRKWGYADSAGKLIVPYKYTDAAEFSSGLARVSIGGINGDPRSKNGYIDSTGQEVIPLQYRIALDFHGRVAPVAKKLPSGMEWIFIDKSGKETIHFKNSGFSRPVFTGGLFRILDEGPPGGSVSRYIDTTGKVFSHTTDALYGSEETDDSVLVFVSNDKYGFIDNHDNVIVPASYDYAANFNEGLARVEKNNIWTFIDKNGKEAFPLNYEFIASFSDGLAAVCLNRKWGYIDPTGKLVIPLNYDYAHNFHYSLAFVQSNGRSGAIGKSGNELIPAKYEDFQTFSDNFILARLNGKWGLMDTSGNMVVPARYDLGDFNLVNGLIYVGHDFNHPDMILDKNGKPL